jgi:hypothetical protein
VVAWKVRTLIHAKELQVNVDRYWSSNWDISEGENNWKEKTLKQNGLVNKLFIPV